MDTKHEEQLERDVINALRARGLRESMEQWDEEERLSTTTKVKPFWPKVAKVATYFAVAAMFCGVVLMAVPRSTWNMAYRWTRQQYAHYILHQNAPQVPTSTLLALAAPSVERMETHIQASQPLGADSPLLEAIIEYNEEHYRSALSILDNEEQDLEESDVHYSETIESIEYLSALCELGLDHRKKAKRQLQTISQGKGRYSKDAQLLLKHFK